MTDPAFDLAARLSRHFEGFYPKAYQCPAGVWTIGYGHTKGVRPGDTVTKVRAEADLDEDLADAAHYVDRSVKVPLEPNEYAALIDFVFNLGAGALAGSTLLKLLNKGDRDGATLEFLKWDKCHVDGKLIPLAGLTKRRRAEATLFSTGKLILGD